ncbi:peptidoglycan amidohydrolase family protein [Anaerococcus urinomassiliensis]|uniref:peptidoglycan amidohydrolase family protein n=1 Tax=Anaerococcus urinomassiliensis TaxID=1745712 RepID=UPI000939CF88|nr:peptidoglycan amidohydrolase family protein [Anaerococcus urinomassiliensis]
MKKINKTLLLASTLFVSQAVTLSENAYADEGYDLNVEVSTEESSDASLKEVQPISLDQVDSNEDSNEDITLSSENLDENEEAISENKDDYLDLEEEQAEEDTSIENEENTSIEKEENEDSETRQKEELTDEVNEESEEYEQRDDLVYYNDKNLDEILTMIDDVDAKTSENSQSVDNKSTDNQTTEDQTVTEETNINHKVYYAPKATGVIVEEKNTTKYYENNKLVKNAQVIVNDRFYNIDSKGNATNPKAYWTVMGANLYYSDETGHIVRGIKEIKNKKYYFNNDGILQLNRLLVTNESHYDIGREGEMVAPRNKWVTINSKKYYNDNNGKLLKGIAKIADKTYYFDNDGVLKTNKKVLTESRFYTVDGNGIATNRKNYWFNLGGKTYRTNKNGSIITGLFNEGNNTYVFDDQGVLFQNTSIIAGGKYYNIDKNGLVNNPKNSWVTYNGQKYHTNENGYVKEGVWKIDDKYYYFTSNGLTANKTITQQGVVYNVDENGIATKEDNNIPGEKSVDKVIEWMFNARANKLTYNMGAGRNTASQADCSSAVYRSLIYGGFLGKDAWVGNTETLFQMGTKGKVMYEVKESEIQYGDIFVAGRPGGSAGAAGHTGFILNPTDDTIIHMSYSKNGVAVTPRKGYMGDSRGLPIKYFRLVGGNSANTYLNKK